MRWPSGLTSRLRRTRLALGLAGATLAMLGASGLYLPMIARLRQRQAALRDLRVTMAVAKERLPRLPEEERAFQELSRRFAAVSAQWGTSESLARMLDLLRDLARQRHLELAATQPPHDARGEGIMALDPELTLQPIPLTLRLVGRYRQIGEFLGALERVPFLLEVQHISIVQHPETSPRLEAQVELAVYVPVPS